jgi:hypothetical protein
MDLPPSDPWPLIGSIRGDVSRKLKIGVIVDRMTVTRWQAEALRTLAGSYDMVVYNCANSRAGRRRFRHGLYYLLNLLTIRNAWTRRGPIPTELPVLQTHVFDSDYEGAWQSLPESLLAEIARDPPAAIVKFGMGLLRIPPAKAFGIPILSYHHGDPAQFRGRPAGFYELLSGAPMVGQVVQRLSNALDAGEVLAFAQTKAWAHSYRATLVEAYRHSPLILGRAIENALGGGGWTPQQWGPNYRLPGNLTVVRFLLGRVQAAVARLVYGLFRQKRWQVATTATAADADLESLIGKLRRTADWHTYPTPAGYTFLADPFLHPERGLLVEAMNRRSCRGEILHVGEGGPRRMSRAGGHFSYPAVVADGDSWHVVPEISDWSPALRFKLEPEGLGEAVELRLPGAPRLLDPTPFTYEDTVYLFGNLAYEGPSVLRLWFAPSLKGEFVEHPASPIKISPNGGRMAGSPSLIAGQLLRFGQDFRRGYGDGLTAFAITRLDPEHYQEEPVGELRFDHCHGPHTLNVGRGIAAFDYYREGFSLLAGLRRWRERRAAGRKS